ncbi:MAG TPA: CtsR family transcriptional regulator [Clostridiales bacterium]|nr:CtsR family transcriptional regulator [Clostridiales bacterium]
MRVSDLVAQYITKMLDEDNGIAEIQRNELAGTLGCVPSQINYVLSSRFTQEQGYVVESRRGGGGYIRITRISMDYDTSIMHLVNSIGNTLDSTSAQVMIENLLTQGYIDTKTARLIQSAVSERVYTDIPKAYRNTVRAAIFKNMLLAQY